jgi:hypothetical protein
MVRFFAALLIALCIVPNAAPFAATPTYGWTSRRGSVAAVHASTAPTANNDDDALLPEQSEYSRASAHVALTPVSAAIAAVLRDGSRVKTSMYPQPHRANAVSSLISVLRV